MFCTFTSALSAVCVQCPIWLFAVAPWFHTFLASDSGIFRMILRWLQLPLLLLLSLLFLRSIYIYLQHMYIYIYIYCISIVRYLYFRISAYFLITFLILEVSTPMNIFLLHDHGFLCPVYCWVWFSLLLLLLLLSLLFSRRYHRHHLLISVVDNYFWMQYMFSRRSPSLQLFGIAFRLILIVFSL